VKNSPVPKAPFYITREVKDITNYTEKTLYTLRDRGVVKPEVRNGWLLWSQADVDAILAHREKNRPRRLAILTSDRAVASGR
jgi:hypothetical protein